VYYIFSLPLPHIFTVQNQVRMPTIIRRFLHTIIMQLPPVVMVTEGVEY
jgi:hypothetical protein